MSLSDVLPPSLDLPPHLSAHKYFFVCTLTVAAWDTLVLSPRTWRLLKTEGWPLLKILYHFLRLFLVAEFTIVGVAFFDTGFTQQMCSKFYLFEPICTAILLAICSVVHVIRINAIYDRNRTILMSLGGLTFAQIIVTAICCAFYHSVPFEEGQGCLAGPKHTWVGIYWVFPTLLYTASFVLAVMRSLQSVQGKSTNYWYLMLRDHLNVYAAIFIVNLTNVIFWFVATPTGPEDSIKTIVTSMAAVLTTTMTLRIILGVRGSLEHGGSFSGTYSSTAATSYGGRSQSHSRGTTHVISAPARSGAAQVVTKDKAQTYTVDMPDPKDGTNWAPDGNSVHDKDGGYTGNEPDFGGVKVTIDREVDYPNQDYRGNAQ